MTASSVTAMAYPSKATWYERGMTLRDYFAAKALQGILAKNVDGPQLPEFVADAAYLYADAMMERREK